jgi:hypothetical protein
MVNKMSWLTLFKLHKDEEIIDSWQGTREVIGPEYTLPCSQNGKEKVTANVQKDGLLVLTNQRLIFLEGKEPDYKKIGESIKVTLLDVNDVSFERSPVKHVEEAAGFETHVFSLKKVGKKKEFNKFKKLLDKYINKNKE